MDKVPVSDLCEELSLKPTVFYRWQKEFFENGVEEKQKRIEFPWQFNCHGHNYYWRASFSRDTT